MCYPGNRSVRHGKVILSTAYQGSGAAWFAWYGFTALDNSAIDHIVNEVGSVFQKVSNFMHVIARLIEKVAEICRVIGNESIILHRGVEI